MTVDTETKPEQRLHAGWIVGIVLLLLLAAAIPFLMKYYLAHEMMIDIEGNPGGEIVWRFESGRMTKTGVTNLPVKLVFHGRVMRFTANRTNYTGTLKVTPQFDGRSNPSMETDYVIVWHDGERSRVLGGSTKR